MGTGTICDSLAAAGYTVRLRGSAAYQSFLRYRRNPYRSADGKKLRTARATAFTSNSGENQSKS